MSTFYFLHLLDKPGTPVATGVDDPGRDRRLSEPGNVSEWDVPELALPGRPSDYLANDLGLRLCSTRMRSVLDDSIGPDDRIQWLPAKVRDSSATSHDYWVLHMVDLPDVLDPHQSILARNTFVVKPVVSADRVGSHKVFSFPGATTRLIIAESVKRSLEAAACTGVDFAKVAVA